MWVYMGMRWLVGQRPRRGRWPMLISFEPGGWDLSLEAWIWAWRLGFELHDWDMSFMTGIWASMLGFELQCWDLSLEAGIWASRLGFEPKRPLPKKEGGKARVNLIYAFYCHNFFLRKKNLHLLLSPVVFKARHREMRACGTKHTRIDSNFFYRRRKNKSKLFFIF